MKTPALTQLKQHSIIVADTGDYHEIAAYKPQDATTNPSLILTAITSNQYPDILTQAKNISSVQDIQRLRDQVAVLIGVQVSRVVPGFVSTEIDATLSFNTQATVAAGQRLIEMYNDQNVASARILLKIAATWEGIAAARILESQGLHCNLTLLFSFAQAQACADAGVTLISPFVGRIDDWYHANADIAPTGASSPGVDAVKRIYAYYKHHEYPTQVMAASFRNIEQIISLAGCDKLTIAPTLLAKLEQSTATVINTLQNNSEDAKQAIVESYFRLQHNADAMATEKLAAGIRGFAADQQKLDTLLYG